MSAVSQYFAQLADTARNAVAKEFPRAAPAAAAVADTSQRSAATCWQAVAVHPMQVLETGYQDVVRAAGADARTDDDRREAESAALSRFFALGSTTPLRLEVPPGALDTLLSGKPLVDELLDRLASDASLVHDKLDHPEWGGVTLGDLTPVVATASKVVAAMAPAGIRSPLPAGVEQAARYLRLLGTGAAPAQAVADWTNEHQNHVREDSLRDLLATLEKELVTPLRDPANAVAAVRALYNIDAFTLVRLLHRFEGGTAATPMDLAARRVASGSVTGAMHPASITAWHEKQVAALATAVAGVDQALRIQLRTERPVTRFYLKGGRALFTALGTPALGTNDWDTGILIDPDLPPDAWYTAFAGVHDTVVRTLDGFRFGYTQELYAAPPTPHATVLAAAAAPSEPDVDNAAFSEAAERAEDQVHRAQLARGTTPLTAGAVALLGEVAQRPGAPVGINGELIDVGIPTRSSVELRELWHAMTVAAKPGVSGTALPVPTLPYYVADLSTILREAVADERGEPDHKLGKRLVRLATVLASPELTGEIASRLDRVRAALPTTVRQLAPDVATVEGRLQVFTLADLLDSVGEPPARFEALDAYLAQQLSLGLLYDERDQQVTRIWAAVEAGVAEVQRADALSVLSVQAGMHRVAGAVLDDRVIRQRAWGVDVSQTRPAGAWKTLVTALDGLARLSQDAARFVVTGALGLHLQVWHAGAADDAAVAPVDRVTVDLWLREPDPARSAVALKSVEPVLASLGAYRVVGDGADARGVLALDLPVTPKIGVASGQTALVIRPVAAGDVTELDTIRGWSVAPNRRLVEDYLRTAAALPDFDLRGAANAASDLLLRRVLGHAIGSARTARAF
jgi:hypothetical protein